MTESDYCPETGDQPRDSLAGRDLTALVSTVERIQGGPLRTHVFRAARELLDWQKSDLDQFKAKLPELRSLLLAAVSRPLTVAEARACRVCRFCRKEQSPPFLYSYGNESEYAHTECRRGHDAATITGPAIPDAIAAAVAAERERCAVVAETTKVFFVYEGDKTRLDLETATAKKMADAIVDRIRKGG